MTQRAFRCHSSFAILFLLGPTDLKAQIALPDDLGRGIRIPDSANHIISLAPSITETLFAIGAGEHIAGVTDYCNVPLDARKKRRVGGMINPNIEAIVSLNPDLIS